MRTQVHIAMMWKPLFRYSEAACKEAIARKQVKKEDTATTIWQCDVIKGKRFCVAGEREMFDYLCREQQKSVGDLSWYEFITPTGPGFPIWDVDWYIKDEQGNWHCAAWATAKRKQFLVRFFDAEQEVSTKWAPK